MHEAVNKFVSVSGIPVTANIAIAVFSSEPAGDLISPQSQ
jgi:hypothetical protein